MALGRPIGSEIRQNILKIIGIMGRAHGYEIYKHYNNIFPAVHIRSIYYHLKKATSISEVEIIEIKLEEGDYSWGKSAEKIYYSLGKNANVSDLAVTRDYFKSIARK